MTQRRYVLLDRDGTIIIKRHYLSDPAEVELIPGVADGLRQLIEMGLGLAIVTNQSAIGRGYIDEARLTEIHQQLRDLLEAEGVAIDHIYYCPHTPDDNCACRKPQTGMAQQAMEALGFEPNRSFVIGDNASDIEFGQRIGATTFLVRTGYGAQVAATNKTRPDHVVDDVQEAAQVIARLLRLKEK